MAKITTNAKIVPFLWFGDNALEAATFYASLFPNSRIDNVWALPVDTPGGPAGAVKVVDFTLAGEPFVAMQAESLDQFNHSVSLAVNCEDQAEVDRLWAALGEGGAYEDCGWLRDRWGLSWQITPVRLLELMKDPDREKARRVTEAMLKMQKIDVAAIEEAAAEPVEAAVSR